LHIAAIAACPATRFEIDIFRKLLGPSLAIRERNLVKVELAVEIVSLVSGLIPGNGTEGPS